MRPISSRASPPIPAPNGVLVRCVCRFPRPALKLIESGQALPFLEHWCKARQQWKLRLFIGYCLAIAGLGLVTAFTRSAAGLLIMAALCVATWAYWFWSAWRHDTILARRHRLPHQPLLDAIVGAVREATPGRPAFPLVLNEAIQDHRGLAELAFLLLHPTGHARLRAAALGRHLANPAPASRASRL